jgi:hypothetical protein
LTSPGWRTHQEILDNDSGVRLVLLFTCLAVIEASTARGAPVGSDETVADHLAKADESTRAATASRQDAAQYRQSLQKERKTIAILPKAPENPWWRKARLRYEPLIQDAEHGAAESERLAEFHRLRAAELQGR